MKFAYDVWGNRASVTSYASEGTYSDMAFELGAAGTTSYVTYDSVYHTYPLLSVNPEGQASVASYDYALGLPTVETAPNGAVTKGYYDAYGRLTQVEQYKDTATKATTTFSYLNFAQTSGTVHPPK